MGVNLQRRFYTQMEGANGNIRFSFPFDEYGRGPKLRKVTYQEHDYGAERRVRERTEG